jgi:anti-sigma regulatory factor (Ser/Thr protein kinase)
MNCGHPEPLVWRGEVVSEAYLLSGEGGLPIGFDIGSRLGKDSSLIEMMVPATPGTSLLIYTDGLVEACRKNRDDCCGVEGVKSGLSRAILEQHDNPAEGLMGQLLKDGYHLDGDDCTTMIIRCLDPVDLLLDTSILPAMKDVSKLAEECETKLLASGWGGLAAGAVRLLVMEYGANVVDHGLVPAGSNIEFQLRRGDSCCRIVFRDHGREWDVEGRMGRCLEADPYSESGRGNGIIRGIARRMEIIRRNNENIGCFEVAKDYSPE